MNALQKLAENIPMSQEFFAEALDVLFKASAMGLIEKPKDVFKLDFLSIKKLFRQIAKYGFGEKWLHDIDAWPSQDPVDVIKKLRLLNNILEESPNPKGEWRVVLEYIPDNLLSYLLGGISASSVQRYSSAERDTPDDVKKRLHLIALIIGDLSGSYNHEGIRQWFQRSRNKAFDGKSPADLLAGNWKPEDASPSKVRQFAHSHSHL
jgi:hypothetical protein